MSIVTLNLSGSSKVRVCCVVSVIRGGELLGVACVRSFGTLSKRSGFIGGLKKRRNMPVNNKHTMTVLCVSAMESECVLTHYL